MLSFVEIKLFLFNAKGEFILEVVFIPIEKLEEWMVKYKSWRNFVIDSYNIRLSEMLEAIDTLAFLKMDQRLYKYLTDKVKIMRSSTLNTTHQEIAHDLNTSTPIIHHEEEVSIFNCISLQVFKRDYDVSKLVSTRTITFFLCIICTA